MSGIKSLAFGFKSFFVGFSLSRKHPSLIKYIVVPMVVAILFMALGLYFSVSILPDWIAPFLPAPTNALRQGFYWITVTFVAITSFLLVILNSFILANLMNIPLNAMLCESMLEKEFQWRAPDKSLTDWIRSTLYLFAIGLVKTLIIIGLGVLAFVLSFIPFLSFIAVLLGMMILAFDCSDITFEIKEWSLKKRWHFFVNHKVEFLGFAIGIGLFSLIPGLNFILLPFIVLGASHMVHTLDKRTSNDSMSVS